MASSSRLDGVPFTLYEDDRGVEKIFPFDLMPRVIPIRQWQRIEAHAGQPARP